VTKLRITVVILAYGEERYLSDCVGAVLASTGEDTEVVLIDNGAPAAVSSLPAHPRMQILLSPINLGFAGGCNYGASFARGENLIFLNSDAVVEAEAITRLSDAVSDDTVGLVCGGIRLADAPDTMNSVGNPVHYLGVVWAGGFGDPADLHGDVVDVASASGAFLCIRRKVWESLGGFNDQYFAYHEDTELSLRAWQRGSRVQFVPSAVARHHYEFSRNPNKQYLLERNRWLTVLTVYPTPLLRLVLPALVMFDVALCIVAFRQGWLAAKLRSWWWLARHRKLIADRRRFVQAASVISVEQFAALLSSRIEPAMIERPPGLHLLNKLLEAYWAVVLRLVKTTQAEAAREDPAQSA
jgi:GT2 family glycosyltransferase